MFDPTKPVQTRNGTKARILCTDARGKYPIKALVEYNKEFDCVFNYDELGKSLGATKESPYDLVNIPEQVVRYVHIYKETAVIGSKDFDPVPGWSTVKITFEDGELISSEVVR